MNFAAAEQAQQLVAGLFECQPALHRLPVITRHRDRIGVAEKIGCVQHDNVQRVALNPLAAIKQPSQGADRLPDFDPEGALDRVHGTHLVSDRADPADAGDDVQDLAKAAPAQQCFEKPRRLENAKTGRLDRAVADVKIERAFALDAGDVIDLQRPSRHALLPPCGTPRRRR